MTKFIDSNGNNYYFSISEPMFLAGNFALIILKNPKNNSILKQELMSMNDTSSYFENAWAVDIEIDLNINWQDIRNYDYNKSKIEVPEDLKLFVENFVKDKITKDLMWSHFNKLIDKLFK